MLGCQRKRRLHSSATGIVTWEQTRQVARLGDVVQYARRLGANSRVLYGANGAGGSGSFLSLGGVYQFGSLWVTTCIPPNVTGNYTGP